MKHIKNGTRTEGEYIKNKVIQYNMSILTDEARQTMEEVRLVVKMKKEKFWWRNRYDVFYHLHIDFYGLMNQFVMTVMAANFYMKLKGLRRRKGVD